MSEVKDYESQDWDNHIGTVREMSKENYDHYMATWEPGEEPNENGIVKYGCNECGTSFMAYWRSKYSPEPKCPHCGGDDMLTMIPSR